MNWEYPITESVYRKLSRPIAKFLNKWSVDPNYVTILSALIGVISSVLIATGKFWISILAILVSQILDCADGDLARISNKVSNKGAYLDTMLDRLVDSSLIIGLVARDPNNWFLGMLALSSSLIVSFSRAAAESRGISCKVGIGGRDFRLLTIMIGLLLGRIEETLLLLFLVSSLTVLQRSSLALRKL